MKKKSLFDCILYQEYSTYNIFCRYLLSKFHIKILVFSFLMIYSLLSGFWFWQFKFSGPFCVCSIIKKTRNFHETFLLQAFSITNIQYVAHLLTSTFWFSCQGIPHGIFPSPNSGHSIKHFSLSFI